MIDQDAILEILDGGGPEIDVFKENLGQLIGFLDLVDTLDKLPQMDRRVSKDGVSLYHAISKEKEMATLEAALGVFFGEPVKTAGAPLSSDLTDSLTIDYLGGATQDQALFLKRIGQSELYGALFPWQKKVDVITVHLGLYNPVMSNDDYKKLEKLVTETIAQRVPLDAKSSLAGQVQGIGLPSFLQMSEKERSTCSLRISSGEKSGMLHLLNGDLIDAETGDLKHKEAAFAILGWDNSTIEVLKTVGRTKNEIRLPLMQLLMEGQRQKDRRELEKDAPLEKALEKNLLKKEAQKQERKKPQAGVESGRAGVAPERERPDNQAAGPVEKKSIDPQKIESEADVTIDKSLIQEHAPRHSKREKTGKSAIDLKSRKTMVMVAVLAVLVLCAGGYFIFQGIKGGGVGGDIEQLMAKVERLTDADAQEKLLMDFINAHEPGEDTASAGR
ncbi:MAG: DUF4388 domain-containing protein [Deltaproteobacteria bacterium]|jgi:hypothetical protein|nr:DUF4388 domain-containing protein [Deltaproteobacteria bacterium]